MCEPVTLALVAGGLAAASGGIGIAQADKAGRELNSHNSKMFKENRRNAIEAGADAHEGLSARHAQSAEARAERINSVKKEADAARSTATVAALESGASGASVGALLSDFERQETEFVHTTMGNQGFEDDQFSRESDAINTGQTSRIASGIRRRVARPNFLNSALQVGSGAFSAGTSAYGAAGGFLPDAEA